MKVYTGKYPTYYTTWHLARLICFWEKRNRMDFNKEYLSDRLGDWLSQKKDGKPTWLSKTFTWFNKGRKQKVKVRIDPWDTWNLDYTLALIILPALKEFSKDPQGAPCVDDEDVPKGLRSTDAPPKENEWDVDDNHFKRWDWVLGEMIAAFEIHTEDDGLIDNKKVFERRARGLKLFGKYYCGLWS